MELEGIREGTSTKDLSKGTSYERDRRGGEINRKKEG